MESYLKRCFLIVFFAFSWANNHILTEKQQNEIMLQVMQIIWEQAMEAKEASNAVLPHIREELLENLCSSAPSSMFITHADLADELALAENTSASVFVSTDNQNSWIENSDVNPIDAPGYDNTWGATTTTDGGNNVSWYLSGSVDSGSLGLEFGQVSVSQAPYNEENSWPPSENLYATIATDDLGETSSGQDIVNIRATYSDDRLYTSMGLDASCCNEGGFFGPWNLYAIAIVNPDALDNAVAYAYAYGDGGFGQLYPGIYKIYGDFSDGVGEVGGFDVLSENFDYSTAGNQLQASSLLSIITNDSDWGVWPNSFGGLALVGVTVEAGLDGLDVAITPLDNSDVGVFVLSSQSQAGNTPPVLLNPSYEEGILSITYLDAENNLAEHSSVFIEDMAFMMVPESHTYSDGVVFSADVGPGYSMATFNFSDGDGYVTLDFDIGGDGSCQLLGDANNDATVNVLDVVLTVNLILNGLGNYEECSDINSDGTLNVLDIVGLINIILGI